MNISVSSRSMHLNEETLEDVSNHVYAALSRYDPPVNEVRVSVENVPRPNGDKEKLCRLAVKMKGIGSFSIKAIEEYTVIAVMRAVEQAAERIRRYLDLDTARHALVMNRRTS